MLQKDETIRIIKEYVEELSGFDLPEEIIQGLIITKEIRSIQDALFLSKFLIRLEKLTKSWELNRLEKSEINHQAAFKLCSICEHFNYHPRLLSVLLAAGIYEIKAQWINTTA